MVQDKTTNSYVIEVSIQFSAWTTPAEFDALSSRRIQSQSRPKTGFHEGRFSAMSKMQRPARPHSVLEIVCSSPTRLKAGIRMGGSRCQDRAPLGGLRSPTSMCSILPHCRTPAHRANWAKAQLAVVFGKYRIVRPVCSEPLFLKSGFAQQIRWFSS